MFEIRAGLVNIRHCFIKKKKEKKEELLSVSDIKKNKTKILYEWHLVFILSKQEF